MKKHLPLLVSAVLLAGQFAGCASSSGTSRAAGHTIETAVAPDIQLPFPTDDFAGPAAGSLSFSNDVRDMDKPAVLQQFGRPAERLTPDLWIYWRFYSAEDAEETGGHDTLVVAFARGRVSGMKLVRGDLLRAQLAGDWQAPVGLAQR